MREVGPAKPWLAVNCVLQFEASQPRGQGPLANFTSTMGGDEDAEEGFRRGHVCSFWNVEVIAELHEFDEASSIIA